MNTPATGVSVNVGGADCADGSNVYCANAYSGSGTYAAPPHAGHAPNISGNASSQSCCAVARPAAIASATAADAAKAAIPLLGNADAVQILIITQYYYPL